MKSKGFSRVFLKFVCTYSLVLIIPIVVFSLFFYSNTKEQFLNNVKEERLHALALLNENISQQNSSIRRMASELVKTSTLSEFNIVHGNTAHVDINSEVRKITGSNSYQTTTFYYLKATQTLYSQSGNYKLWQFNTPHFQYYYPGWNHEEMEAFLEHNSELMIRPAETLIIPSNNTRKMITFLFPLTKSTYTYGTMISLVDVERVEMILSSTYRSPEENLLVYSSAGDFLTSRYEIDNNTETWASKILEKDDGAYSGVIRREGKDYLLSYSARGRMEWRFISFIPVESLTSEMGYIFTEIKLVLLAVFLVGILMTLFSAYKSYNPLRKLLVQLDVQGAKGKNEYELLEDSIATLRKQQREKESELHIQFVYNILLNQYQTVDELNIAAKERGLKFTNPLFTVATVKCSENGAYLRGDLLLELARGESRHIREHGLQGCYSLGLSSSEIIFVCSCQSEKEVLTYLNEVYNLISRRGILPYIGIGELQNSPAKMDDAYHMAALASDALLIKNLSGVLSASNFAQIEKMMPAFPMKQLHSLSFATLRKDTNGIKEELSRLMQLIKHVDTPVYMVRLLFCNIVHILETALLQYEPDAKLSVVSQANTYGTPLGYQEMENEISALAQRLIKHIESAVATGIKDTPKLRIEEVDAFIISHLSSPDFSITVLADAFGLSVSNMSHFFKTQKGVGYKQYIDYMRIEYAQKLLKESDMTVNKVAEASGYANTSSFIRAFKKLTGNTPGEYRKE